MKIAGFQKVSMVDYPGLIVATVLHKDVILDAGFVTIAIL